MMLVLHQIQAHDSVTVSCLFDANPGRGGVPAAIVDELAGGDLAANVGLVDQHTVSAGEWTIAVFAYASAISQRMNLVD